jgi:predicted RNA-binding Zn-ribbon protein involved in translation (DUF1610 family)
MMMMGNAARVMSGGSPASAMSGMSGNMRPGDWVCKSCGDHQFAKNQNCRKCNAPKPKDMSGSMMPGMVGGNIVGNGSDLASMMMQAMASMMGGNLGGNAGGNMGGMMGSNMGGANMKPGDWHCSKCGDHNFARNTNCRKCGAVPPLSKKPRIV